MLVRAFVTNQDVMLPQSWGSPSSWTKFQSKIGHVYVVKEAIEGPLFITPLLEWSISIKSIGGGRRSKRGFYQNTSAYAKKYAISHLISGSVKKILRTALLTDLHSNSIWLYSPDRGLEVFSNNFRCESTTWEESPGRMIRDGRREPFHTHVKFLALESTTKYKCIWFSDNWWNK